MAEMTPMMKQYLDVKEQHKDAILMFRLGDFYEMFFEDAKIASRELELTLTGKSCGLEERAPMCGVPFHAADGYIARLVAKGYKVAICEQMEDPKQAKGIVRRDIIRIVTPGTIVDEGFLATRSTNYMASVFVEDGRSGVVFADVSTGELMGTAFDEDADCERLISEMERFSPVEAAIGGKGRFHKRLEEYLRDRRESMLVFSYEGDEVAPMARETVDKHLNNGGEIQNPMLLTAAAALLDYLVETQKSELGHIREIKIYSSGEFMDIDPGSRRNLELVETMRDKSKKGSIFWVLDRTRTSMGSRMLKGWIMRPLINAAAITNRLSGVEELVKTPSLREELGDALGGVLDIERLMGRVSMGLCNAKDMVGLRSSFAALPRIYKALCSCRSVIMNTQAAVFDCLEDVYDILDRAIVDEPPATLREGGLIKPGYNEDIDRLRGASEHGRGSLGSIEARERERTGIKNLKIKYNKVFGYYIEISKSNLDKVPDDYIRKQTTVNGERFITPELKEVETAVVGATERLEALEYEEFVRVRGRVAAEIERIDRTARAIAAADCIYSLAETAVKNNYVRPEITLTDEIYIKDGRHPVVEKMLKNGLFVPNDTELDCGPNRAAIITGPNMAGKSTYMRQVAAITLMAQMGSFVPAGKCRVGIVDKIFTRIGASDDLAAGQSTFALEMSEVSYILKNATKSSLCILDEVGRGTSTYDGLSIAWAVIEHIVNKIGMKTLFATHYHELTVLEDRLEGVKNYNTVCKKRGDDITFLRKIVRGGTDDSYGIEVAKLSGVPNPVIKRAKEVLATVERGSVGGEPKDKKAGDGPQLSFAVEESPAVEELRKIDVTTLTPIEALNELYKLQQMI